MRHTFGMTQNYKYTATFVNSTPCRASGKTTSISFTTEAKPAFFVDTIHSYPFRSGVANSHRLKLPAQCRSLAALLSTFRVHDQQSITFPLIPHKVPGITAPVLTLTSAVTNYNMMTLLTSLFPIQHISKLHHHYPAPGIYINQASPRHAPGLSFLRRSFTFLQRIFTQPLSPIPSRLFIATCHIVLRKHYGIVYCTFFAVKYIRHPVFNVLLLRTNTLSRERAVS